MNLKALSITACKACGSTALGWHSAIVNRSDVQQGRLNTRDVECIFFLGCDACSETLARVTADQVAGAMNAAAAASACLTGTATAATSAHDSAVVVAAL
ncbi:hypothetical protein [Duganella vulcania]|uniref:hypothetical protein n=1 Tax=Duganella vulcania TaxID=2692166 RepID=UPI00158361AD|nr:hypothetical protein [Duganella vulcania]